MYDFLLIADVALWVVIAFWYWRHPAASAFHPATYYLLFQGLLFTVRPVLARVQGFNSLYVAYEFTPSAADKCVALLGADLAFVTFMLVALQVGRAGFSRAPGVSRQIAQPRATGSLGVMAALCLPFAIASLSNGWSTQLTQASTMIHDAETGFTVNTTGNGYFTDAGLMLGPVAVLLLWAGRYRPWAFLPLAAFVLFKAGTGGRWPVVMALISAALFWMYEHRRRWFPWQMFLLLPPLVAGFAAIGADRGAAIRAAVTGRASGPAVDYFAERPLESMDFANMEFMEYIVHVVPAKTGTYDYFLSNLALFTEPVPRVLWPGKPIGAPVKRFNIYSYGNPIGMTQSVAGAGWMAAGWIGIVLTAALFGWVYGWIYSLYVRSDQDRYKTAMYLIFLPISLACFRDGVLITIAKTSLFTILPVLVWRLLRFVDAGAPARVPAIG